jgi:DNA repair exonuclease SbcCD ATPase subunit
MRIILVISSIFLLSSCTKPQLLQETWQEQVNQTSHVKWCEDDDNKDLTQFYDEFAHLSHDEQQKCFLATQALLEQNPFSSLHKAQLAIMLAMPNSVVRDITNARVQLKTLLNERKLGLRSLSYLEMWYAFTLDYLKQKKAIEATMQQSDVYTKQLQTLQKKYDALEQKYQSLQTKNEELEQKLSEIKNIEKSINAR